MKNKNKNKTKKQRNYCQYAKQETGLTSELGNSDETLMRTKIEEVKKFYAHQFLILQLFPPIAALGMPVVQSFLADTQRYGIYNV